MPDGIFVLDKPLGWTSTKCVSLVRRLMQTKRVGHAGTLDPLATGVLPVCVGRATRVVEYIHDAPKAYLATIRLGVETDTCDAEGVAVATGDTASIDAASVAALLPQFTGRIRQRPPLFSAIKVGGVPAYALARTGDRRELADREVVVHGIDFLSFDGDDLRVEVRCGRGTYIRSIARDLGRALGCGAHLAALRRTRVGVFDHPVSPESLEAAITDGTWPEVFLPPSAALAGRPAAVFAQPGVEALQRGQLVATPGCTSDAAECIAYGLDGEAVAILRHRERDLWHPAVVLRVPGGRVSGGIS